MTAGTDDGPTPRDRVFFIGPNKCGTTSLHRLFQAAGIPALHWRTREPRYLALTMVNNMSLGRRPFAGLDHDHVAFSDLFYAGATTYLEGFRRFRAIHAAYPDAFFVLNTRPVEDWLRSRCAHVSAQKGAMLDRVTQATGLGRDAVVAAWRAMFETHHAEVRRHFGNHRRFLEFDISRDDPQRLVDFFAPVHALDARAWARYKATDHAGATPA